MCQSRTAVAECGDLRRSIDCRDDRSDADLRSVVVVAIPTDKRQTIRRGSRWSRMVSGDRLTPENIGAAVSRCPG